MANNKIQIKRSVANATVTGLSNGEFAFTQASNTLWIGLPDGSGALRVAGAQYPGTLTANQAMVVNSTSGIDKVIVANAVVATLTANGSAGTNGQVLVTNGSAIYWGTGTSGANTYVQFNDSGVANGVPGFTFDKTTNTLFIGDVITIGTEFVANDTTIFLGNTTSNTILGAYNQPHQLSLQSNATVNTYILAGNGSVNTTSHQFANSVQYNEITKTDNGTVHGYAQTYVTKDSGNFQLYSGNNTFEFSEVDLVSTNAYSQVTGKTINKSTSNAYSYEISSNTTTAFLRLFDDTGVNANLIANQSQITIGNSSVNAAINSSAFFVVGNTTSLGSAVFNSNGVALGNVTSTAAPVVSMANTIGNSVLGVTSLTIGGNTTTLAPVVITGNGASFGNSTGTAAPEIYIANTVGNTTVSVSSINIGGNATTLAPVSISGNGVVIGNNTGTASPTINIANAQGNSVFNVNSWSLSNSSANIITANNGGIFANNGTVVFVGNGTVNATHNSSAFFISGNGSTLATAKLYSNGVIIGNNSVVAAPVVYLANTTGNSELTVSSINFAGNSSTLANVTLSGNGLNIGNTTSSAAPVIHIANTTETLDVGVNYIQMAGNNTTLGPVLINGNGASFGDISGSAAPVISVANTTGNVTIQTYQIKVSNSSQTVLTANTTKVVFTGANIDAFSADLKVNNSTISKDLVVNGNTVLGSDTNDRLIVPSLISGNLHPSANQLFLLGNNDLRWAEGHFANVHSNTGYFDGDVQIGGNLEVFGNVTTTNVTSVIVSDPMIYLAGNNYVSDLVDIGFAGNYFDGTTERHTGLFRDASDGGVYKLFTNSEQELSGNNLVNTAANGYTLAILETYLASAGLTSNATSVYITANSTLNVQIVANTLTLSTALAGTEGGTGYKDTIDQAILVGNTTNGYDRLTLGVSGYVLQSNGSALVYDILDGGSF